MLDVTQYPRFVRAMPLFSSTGPDPLREFRQTAFFTRIPEGRDVFIEGDRVAT
jgi:hypothetical protein